MLFHGILTCWSLKQMIGCEVMQRISCAVAWQRDELIVAARLLAADKNRQPPSSSIISLGHAFNLLALAQRLHRLLSIDLFVIETLQLLNITVSNHYARYTITQVCTEHTESLEYQNNVFILTSESSL